MAIGTQLGLINARRINTLYINQQLDTLPQTVRKAAQTFKGVLKDSFFTLALPSGMNTKIKELHLKYTFIGNGFLETPRAGFYEACMALCQTT